MIDPPRPEVRAAVATCRSAGIRPMMITGDHPLTTSSIARDLGIATDDRVVTGTQLNAMSDEDAVEEHDSIDHTDLGHRHMTPEEVAKAAEKKESSESGDSE